MSPSWFGRNCGRLNPDYRYARKKLWNARYRVKRDKMTDSVRVKGRICTMQTELTGVWKRGFFLGNLVAEEIEKDS